MLGLCEMQRQSNAFSRTWHSFQEEMVFLSELTRLECRLRHQTRCQKHLPLRKMRRENSFVNASSVDAGNGEAKRYHLSGDCPVALVRGRGLLLLGSVAFAVTHNGKRFVCSSEERAEEFSRDPEGVCAAVNKFLEENPCFLEMLLPGGSVEEDDGGGILTEPTVSG